MHGDWPLTSPPGCAQSVAGPVSAVLRSRGALVGNYAQLVGATDEEERTADAAKQAVHRRRRIEREDEGDDGGPGTDPEAPQPER